uniref:Uncharacterized protein n=1 Tax=Romanomermis culicivorax TaxID=13658 RepID=A0A915HU22_ROMCU
MQLVDWRRPLPSPLIPILRIRPKDLESGRSKSHLYLLFATERNTCDEQPMIIPRLVDFTEHKLPSSNCVPEKYILLIV